MTVGTTDLIELVEAVVLDFVDEIDPDEVRYDSPTSLLPLQQGLAEVLEGRIADWRIEQTEAHKKEN